MPAVPRWQLFDETTVGSYHLNSRTVRRGFLLGKDCETGRDHPHRKQLLLTRIERLVSVFAVECLDVSVLDSSFDLIVRNRPDVVATWNDREVAERWSRLHRSDLKLRPEPSWEQVESLVADEPKVRELRQRLSSISWFMAYLKEPLAKRFNLEDGVDGHYWAERFDGFRLQDEVSLLACSSYVALNPVLADEAATVEASQYSSWNARSADERAEDTTQVAPTEVAPVQADASQSDSTSGASARTDSPGTDSTGRHSHRAHSGWLAPLTIDGDGFSGAAERRRPTDEGFLRLEWTEYRSVLLELEQRELAERAGLGREELMPAALTKLGISPAAWEAAVRVTRRRFERHWGRAARLRAERRRRTVT